MVGLVVATAVAGAVLIAAARARERRAASSMRAARQAALASVIDLIAVVLGSGGTISEAMVAVAEQGPAAARPGFALVVARTLSGDVLADAIASISAELGPAFHPLATTLMISEQGGAPVGALLQRLADEAHTARSQATLDALGRLPVALLAPLIICQLPALIVGSVVPLAIVAFSHIDG